ncbi:PQQ-binding-like beta-propeller repeat protein [Actinoplanes sp. NPDC049316]|uniref:PQQ-binding-like beta-propeller repeat protein n=1 Tax=Actinoplanes sp. NPDC049316 TaxID=3154727 RepID=UPI0034126B49
MALIELSPETPAPPDPPAAPPAYVYRRFGLALAVLLTLALGGAAPASSLLWQRTGRVPTPVGTDLQLMGGRLYSLDFQQQPPVVTAWSADPVRRLWSTPGPAGTEEEPYFLSAATTDVVMINVRRSTTVLDARTGSVRWRSDTPLQRLDDRTGLVLREDFRPGTEYDVDTGAPGRLYGSTTEELHTEPARSTSLDGVDLRTGRRIWSASVPGSISTAFIGGKIVVLSADRLSVRSPRDGAVLRERVVPRVGGHGPVWGEAVGDILLVHYGGFGEGGPVVAYAVDTLDALWQQYQPDPQGSAAACAGLPCVRSRTEVSVVDPRTGRLLWRADPDTDLLAFGPGSVLVVRGQTSPMRSVDRATGRVLADLGRWRGYVAVHDEAYVLTRTETDGSTSVGMLRAGRTAVQPLGRVRQPTGQCQADDEFVACRVGEAVDVFHYRA